MGLVQTNKSEMQLETLYSATRTPYARTAPPPQINEPPMMKSGIERSTLMLVNAIFNNLLEFICRLISVCIIRDDYMPEAEICQSPDMGIGRVMIKSFLYSYWVCLDVSTDHPVIATIEVIKEGLKTPDSGGGLVRWRNSPPKRKHILQMLDAFLGRQEVRVRFTECYQP